jgi:tRNA uridine 5-carboxymethylaminomethyl modification enzyme
MFTSRAEYRILLRQDNADIRLTEKSHKLGLADKDRLVRLEQKVTGMNELKKFFKEYSVSPEELNGVLASVNSAELKQKLKLEKVLARPNVDIALLEKGVLPLHEMRQQFDNEIFESAEIEMKYESYIQKEVELADKMLRLEDIRLNPDFDYSDLKSLSIEARQKLAKLRPETLGQASRISGVSPADVQVLMVRLGRL